VQVDGCMLQVGHQLIPGRLDLARVGIEQGAPDLEPPGRENGTARWNRPVSPCQVLRGPGPLQRYLRPGKGDGQDSAFVTRVDHTNRHYPPPRFLNDMNPPKRRSSSHTRSSVIPAASVAAVLTSMRSMTTDGPDAPTPANANPVSNRGNLSSSTEWIRCKMPVCSSRRASGDSRSTNK